METVSVIKLESHVKRVICFLFIRYYQDSSNVHDIFYVDEDGNEYGNEVEEMLDLPDCFAIDPTHLEELADLDMFVNNAQQTASPPWNEIPIEIVLAETLQIADGPNPNSKEARGNAINISAGTSSAVSSAASFLDLLFGGDILRTIVKESNSFARSDPLKLTVPELKQYFSLILYMSIVSCPTRRMYWERSHYGNVWVQSVMSRDRFFQISTNLHWKDTSRFSDNVRRDLNSNDGFWMIEDFVSIVTKRFMHFYQCGRFVSIVDMPISFSGRHRLKCYHPKTPDQYYFKAVALQDNETGYVSNIVLYRNEEAQREPNPSSSLWTVATLTEPACYHLKKHVLSLDTNYTTVAAMELCKKHPRCMDVVGSVSPIKQGLCKEELLHYIQRPSTGTIRVCKRALANDSTGYLYQTSWMDTQPLHFLSTFYDGLCSIDAYASNERGEINEITVRRPAVMEIQATFIKTRNQGQKFSFSYFDERFTSDNTQQAIIYRLLRAAVANAHILFQKAFPGMADASLLSFMRMIISEWTSTGDPIPPHLHGVDSNYINDHDLPDPILLKRSKPSWKKNFKDRNYFSGGHFPALCRKVQARQADGTPGIDDRKECKLCAKRIMVLCEKCNAFLCIEETGTLSCFKKFHTQFQL